MPPPKRPDSSKLNHLCLTTLFSFNEFGGDALNHYYNQNALLYPIQEIESRVAMRDFNFFLEYKDFLKVVDTLEKY